MNLINILTNQETDLLDSIRQNIENSLNSIRPSQNQIVSLMNYGLPLFLDHQQAVTTLIKQHLERYETRLHNTHIQLIEDEQSNNTLLLSITGTLQQPYKQTISFLSHWKPIHNVFRVHYHDE